MCEESPPDDPYRREERNHRAILIDNPRSVKLSYRSMRCFSIHCKNDLLFHYFKSFLSLFLYSGMPKTYAACRILEMKEINVVQISNTMDSRVCVEHFEREIDDKLAKLSLTTNQARLTIVASQQRVCLDTRRVRVLFPRMKIKYNLIITCSPAIIVGVILSN